MAITVYLKNGSRAVIERATKVAEGYFVLSDAAGGGMGMHKPAVELQDDAGAVVGSFLHEEVVGYCIHDAGAGGRGV